MNHHDRVIALSLEAIAEPSLWPRALLALADAAGCSEATVIGYNAENGNMSFALIGGRIVNLEGLEPYLSHYGRLDPMRQVFGSLPNGAFATSHEALSAETFEKNEFIQDYLLPLGGRYYGGWSFIAPDTRDVVGIALHSEKQPIDRDVLLQMSELAGHVCRATRQSMRIARAKDQAVLLRKALSQIGLAFLLVDAESFILDISNEATVVLEQGRHIRVDRGGRLVAVSAGDTLRLRALINDAARNSRGGSMRFTTSEHGSSAVLQVSPCGVAGTNPFNACHANCALVLIKSPKVPHAYDHRPIRSVLNCSVAEAEVAAALASGRTPGQIARDRDVSISTVRSQIRALMAITETSRITDFVKLVVSCC